MKPLAYSVLRELSDGELHSIEKLARSLKANSRCIISSLRDIQRFGIIIENTYEHYYRWHNPINWINENEIIKYLHKNKQLFQFVILNSVDSTNLYLLDRVKSSCVNLHKILVIIAEMQTRGRGRFGRQWFSGIGEGLTFSMLWRVNRSMSELSGLSLVVGVAIVRALKKFGINDFSLKWPNDVLFCFRKLAGILIELNNDICSGTFVVIGIGLK